MSTTDTQPANRNLLCRLGLHRWRYTNRWDHPSSAVTYRACRRRRCTAERRWL